MSTRLYYWLLQIPGLLLLSTLLGFLVHLEWIDWSLAGLVVLGWLIKDAVMYPWLKSAFDRHGAPDAGPAGLVGQIGELTVTGFVRVRGELWQAELVSNADEFGGSSANPALQLADYAAGTPVRIRDARGMTLIVEAITNHPDAGSSNA